MKKSIITIAVLLSIKIIPTFAGGVIGATEPTQWLNKALLAIDSATNKITTIQQQLATYKQTIQDPLGAALISITQKAMTDDIISWANGGFSGDLNSTIVENPEVFIRDAGLESIRASLSQVPYDSILGDSIFTSILNAGKDISLTTQLRELSKSPTASIIKKSNCEPDDGSDPLLDIATKEVTARGGTMEDINIRYEELWLAICDGDINDPKVAKRLDNLAMNNPALGGWDLWLTSANDTPQQRITQATALAEQKAAAKKEMAGRELTGISAVSRTECKEKLLDIDGNDTGICKTQAIVTAGKSVQDALSKAAGLPLDRLANLTGADAFTGLLTGFITKVITDGLNTAYTSTKTTGSNTSTQGATESPNVQDLANNPEGKESILTPIFKNLKETIKVLTHLETIDDNFLSDLQNYEMRIKEVKMCFDKLIEDIPTKANDNQVSSAYTFLAERQNRVDKFRASINPEKIKIAEAFSLINEIKIKLENSNSTKEILSIYKGYSSSTEAGDYPDFQSDAARTNEYDQAKADVASDLDPSTKGITLARQEAICKEIRDKQNSGSSH